MLDSKDFNNWCKEFLSDRIIESIELSENGLIKIERNIEIPNFNGINRNRNSKYYDNKYGDSLGEYWTYLNDAGHAYGAEGSVGPEIVLYGLCRPEDVDWERTISTFIENGCAEYELCFNGQVELYAITTAKGNHTIWRGNLIFNNN